MGSLYMVAELDNALPSNSGFLERLAGIIKERYYESANDKSRQRVLAPEAALKQGLQSANDFLAQETKQGNVDWLGNLHFALFLVAPKAGSLVLYFTKVGATRVWMGRHGSLVDVGKTIESARAEQVSPKVFGAVGSGRMAPGDRLFVLTPELFEAFAKTNLLQGVARLQEEKEFKDLFKTKEKELSAVSGALFFLLTEAVQLPDEEGRKSGALANPLSVLSQLSAPRLPSFSNIRLPGASFPKLPKIPLALPFPRKKLPFTFSISDQAKRVGILMSFLFLLLLGFAIFGAAPQALQQDTGEKLTQAQALFEEAEAALILREQSRANALLQQAWQLVNGLEGEEFVALRSELEGKLAELNKIEDLQELQVVQGASLASVDVDKAIEERIAEALPSDSHAADAERFGQSVYVLQADTGEILKSSGLTGGSVSFTSWVEQTSLRKPLGAKAIAIDGNIWVLAANNEIHRYFRGSYQETIALAVFPAFQNPLRIETSPQIPYLAILEPELNRLVIIAKTGSIIKQYRAEAFKNAKDLALSPDGKSVYVTDGQLVFQVFPIPSI